MANLTNGMYDRLYLQNKAHVWSQSDSDTIHTKDPQRDDLPGERQDLQDAKQQSQAKVLPLLEKKVRLHQHQTAFFG